MKAQEALSGAEGRYSHSGEVPLFLSGFSIFYDISTILVKIVGSWLGLSRRRLV